MLNINVSSTKKKYSGLQILRFVAASFVVIAHAILNSIENWSDALFLRKFAYSFGEVGVIVFFGVSGFIMVTTRYESFGSAKHSFDFILSRFIRILPIYAIATTLQYINKSHLGGVYNPLNYIKSIFFIPYIGDGGLYRPILGQGWTLNYEMFFYLVFAISLYLTKIKGLLLSILLFVSLAFLQDFNISDNIVLKFYTNHILLYFICGMLVAITMKKYNTAIPRIYLPMLVVILLMFFSSALSIASGLYHVIPKNSSLLLSLIVVFFCVYASASCQPNHHRWFQAVLERLGDASYSTYLFHGFFLGAMKFLLKQYIGEGQYWGILFFTLFCIVGANLTGLFTYTFVETQVSSILNKQYHKLRTGK